MGTHNTSAPELEALAVSWSQDTPVPRPQGDERLVLVVESLRALSLVRRQVRAFLTASLEVAGAEGDDAVERAILVIDELTSNALRHGSPPSRLSIGDEVDRWLVIISDTATGRSPTPAVDRPAGAGGYGLHVIGDLSIAYGVHYAADHKLVWAVLSKGPH